MLTLRLTQTTKARTHTEPKCGSKNQGKSRGSPALSSSSNSPNVPGPICTLLVICRPSGRRDVPFRSVASRIIKGLSQEAHQPLRGN